MIPAFHPNSEALMSNLASRAHEWKEWEISEFLYEIPLSAKSKGKRSTHFRITLAVNWIVEGVQNYTLNLKSSPSRVLIERRVHFSSSFEAVRILARRTKDSKGRYTCQEALLLDKFLT